MYEPATVSIPFDLSHPIRGQLLANLRGRIVQGELAPGTRISEKDIADLYSMSRQPVREAFIRLESEGLLEIRPQRGTFVRKISVQSVENSRFVREAVEADVARLAAMRAGERDLAELHAQIDRQGQVKDGAAAAFMQLDENFHRTLADLAGVPGAWRHLQPIKMHMDRVRYLTATEFPLSRLVAEHRNIVGAIAARDADAAEAAIRRHLRGVLEDLPLMVEAQPGFFEAGPAGPPNQPQGRTT